MRFFPVLLAFLFLAAGCAPAGQQAFAQTGEPDAPRPGAQTDSSYFQGMDYRMVGPYRGGRSTAVTGVPGRPHTYLMGTTGGGVWRTTDLGKSWTNISDGYFGGSIGAVNASKAAPNVIYVGTGSACIRGNTSTGHGVYKSTDGGRSWQFAGLPETGQIGDIQIHPEDPDLVYVAALGHAFGHNEERGVYRSENGGETWERVLHVSDSTGAVDLSMNPSNPRKIYASMWSGVRKPWAIYSGSENGGLYKTTDGGEEWRKLSSGLPKGLVGKSGVTVSPADPSRVWAIIEAKEPEGGIYRSDDHGRTWKRVNRNRKLRQRAYYYMHIQADPQDPNTVYALNTGLYKSVDGGESFESYEVPHGDVHDLWIRPNDPTEMVVANDGGGQVSVDRAESWSTMYNQPTAEMYSVTVDNQFPYRVYGPQQDNSTISLPNWNSGGVSPKQYWEAVGGCETGPISLDPDDPSTVYAGCYGGVIARHNRETQQTRNVMVYPQLQLGQAPKDLKERFQWVSPIQVSQHNPSTVYHASQRLHRTRDGGMTWETISSDLTTDDPMHQEFGGGPLTNEGTGVEVYGTIFALTESPHQQGTLWAGTDDGRIHITRDGGGEWTEVTPADLPEGATVNRIEASPHQPGEAYAAVFRYREDDYSPYLFHTDDYGASWESLADGENGIPAGYPVRVVREDPEREGLLYAGTEFGMFFSTDDGATWEPLQLNLPTTPITDLKVHRGDLVVATQGRSFWVLDELGPLRQLTEDVREGGQHLFEPAAAHRISVNPGGEGRWPEGPPNGASIFYSFDERPEGEVTMEIVAPDGTVMRRLTSDSTKTVGPPDYRMAGMEVAERQRFEAKRVHTDAAAAERFEDQQFVEEEEGPLTKQAGMNQYVWNLRTPPLATPDRSVTWGYTGGVKAVPGTYEVRMTVNGETQTRSFEVKKDPRLTDVTQQGLRKQFTLATDIAGTLQEVYAAIERVRLMREHMLAVAGQAERAGYSDDLIDRVVALSEKLSAIEQAMIQTRNESGQDMINYPPQLDNQIAYLYGHVAEPEGSPTDGARQRYQDLQEQWARVRSRLNEAVEQDVQAFNERVEDLDVPPVPTTLAN
jgi:photosystem II stability/assembly factor-like uncharacterized protein